MSQNQLVPIRKVVDEFEQQLDMLCDEFREEMRKARVAKRGRVILFGQVTAEGSISDDSHVELPWQYPLK